MTDPSIRETVLELARARRRAREGRDWAEADRLRAEIEAAGWKVVDRGTDFKLTPSHPPDAIEAGRTRYGSSASVPSRLEQPPTGVASVVLVASDRPTQVARAVKGLWGHVPDGTQVVIVANGRSGDELTPFGGAPGSGATDPGGPTLEVVWLSAGLGPAAALNAGIRRTSAAVVVLLDAGAEPTGDLVSPLVAALADPTVAVAGGWGSVSLDMRHFTDAPAGEVDVIDATCFAFRRSDYVERGPLDERFHSLRHLATWWSLVLRDEGEGSTARRAIRLAELPLRRREPGDERPTNDGPADGPRDRAERRDVYRLLDRFGRRSDLYGSTRPNDS